MSVLVFLLTLYAVYSVLRLFGVLDITQTATKTKNTIEVARKNNKDRRREQNKLKMFSTVTELFRGLLMNDIVYDNHKYYIERLDIRSDILGRLYTPEELRGKHALPFALSLLTIPLCIFIPWILLLPIGCFVYLMGYQTSYKMQIQDEDEIIDNYFIDLYLLLYSKLKQGSRARLQGTVENYIDTLEGQANTEVTETMLKLSKYLLNLLALYEDHVAIPKLRDAYHSATIINFCNVATQALNGIDNSENLLTFKMQLVDRKTELMRKRQQQILAKGERSIYAIWVILFIFVIVGWYSKLPTGFF